MTQDKIKDRIRKLLALARDAGATSAEAEAAMAKARAMMLENSIAEQDTLEAELKIILSEGLDNGDKWQKLISWSVAKLLGCKTLQYLNGKVSFVGRPDLVDACEQLYAYVCEQIEAKYKLALAELGKHGTLDKATRGELRKTFKQAAAQAVVHKVYTIVRQQPSNERALVVINQAEAAAEQFIDDNITTKKSRALRPISTGIGTGAGYTAGKSIKLQDEVNR